MYIYEETGRVDIHMFVYMYSTRICIYIYCPVHICHVRIHDILYTIAYMYVCMMYVYIYYTMTSPLLICIYIGRERVKLFFSMALSSMPDLILITKTIKFNRKHGVITAIFYASGTKLFKNEYEYMYRLVRVLLYTVACMLICIKCICVL